MPLQGIYYRNIPRYLRIIAVNIVQARRQCMVSMGILYLHIDNYSFQWELSTVKSRNIL